MQYALVESGENNCKTARSWLTSVFCPSAWQHAPALVTCSSLPAASRQAHTQIQFTINLATKHLTTSTKTLSPRKTSTHFQDAGKPSITT
jgi:hypothetical protein